MEKKSYVVEKDEITLVDLLHVFRKRKVTFILVFSITVLVTLFYLKYMTTPLYEAVVKIKIPTTGGGLGSLGTTTMLLGSSGASPDVNTHIEVLKSRRVLEQTVREALKRANKLGNDSKESSTNDFESLVNLLRNERYLTISNLKNSPIIEIRLYGSNKDFSLLLLRTLIEVYTNVYTEITKDEKMVQLEELEKLLPKIEAELNELGNRIKEFRLSKSFSPSEEANLYFSRLMSLTTDRNNLSSELEILKANQTTIKSEISKLKGSIKEKVYTPKNPTLENYSNRLAELQIQYNTMLLKYTEEHPDVIAIKKQMTELQKLIDEEIKKTANSQIESPNPLLQGLYSQLMEIEMKIPIIAKRIALVENAISEVESKIRKLPDYEQQYLALQRDYSLKQGIYVNLTQKYEELKVSTAGAMVNKPQVLDPPNVSKYPVKPNKKLSLTFGAVTGIFFGILAVFLKELTDKKIRTYDDIKHHISVPLIVFAKEDKSKAIKNMLAYVLNNYPSDKKIAILSPDDERSIDEAFQLISETLRETEIPFETLSVDGNALLMFNLDKSSTLSKDHKYTIAKAPVLRSHLEGYIVAKKSDGVLLVVRLNASNKTDLLQSLSWCSDNDVKVYGLIVFAT